LSAKGYVSRGQDQNDKSPSTHLAVVGKRKSDSAREVLRLRSAIRLLS
jgi:hypothetical protein